MERHWSIGRKRGLISDNFRASLIGMLLTIVGFVGFGNFNEQILGSSISGIQQVLIVILWCFSAALSLGMPKVISVDQRAVMAFALLLTLCFYSAIWSAQPLETAFKATALVTTSTSAMLTVRSFGFKSVLNYLRRGLTLAIVISVAVVNTRPDIGLMEGWIHAGKWRGLYDQKQLLGTSSALLFALQLYLKNGKFRLVDWAIFVLCAVCIIQSESAVAAVISCSMLLYFLFSRFYIFRFIAVVSPFLLAVSSGCVSLWLGLSGARSLSLFGSEITFQNRTVIWEFALRAWSDVALMGYGLNGFWTDGARTAEFQAENGWALDNYHSGFVATLAELGMVGFSLLLFLLAIKLKSNLSSIKNRKASNVDGFAVAFLLFFAILNLTETFLFRSTSSYFSLAVICFLYVVPRREAERNSVSQSRPGQRIGLVRD